jgi:hypothetical protein
MLENSPICNWFSFGFIPSHAYVFRYWPSVWQWCLCFIVPPICSSVWISFAVNSIFLYLINGSKLTTDLYFTYISQTGNILFYEWNSVSILFSELTTGISIKVSSWLISFDLNFELVLINQKLKRIIDLIFCYWDPIW